MACDCVLQSMGEDSNDRCFLAPLLPSSMRLATLCLALMGATSLLHAQVPATWVPGNVETRSHDYDLLHQRIELRDINWDSTSLNGRVITTLAARRTALDSVILDKSLASRSTRAIGTRGS